MISDLYYCLADYWSRQLAVDPCSLTLSEMVTDEERTAVIEALKEDLPLRGGMVQDHDKKCYT